MSDSVEALRQSVGWYPEEKKVEKRVNFPSPVKFRKRKLSDCRKAGAGAEKLLPLPPSLAVGFGRVWVEEINLEQLAAQILFETQKEKEDKNDTGTTE